VFYTKTYHLFIYDINETQHLIVCDPPSRILTLMCSTKEFYQLQFECYNTICNNKKQNNKRLELELVVQPSRGFFGNLVGEEMGVGLGGGDKLNKFHELVLSN